LSYRANCSTEIETAPNIKTMRFLSDSMIQPTALIDPSMVAFAALAATLLVLRLVDSITKRLNIFTVQRETPW
jgi:hypothetical protein